MKFFILLFLLVFCSSLEASDSLIINKLLQRIDNLQVKNNGVFPKGAIPSYRMYALNKTRYKADINPFYTALVGFTLQDIKKDLTRSQLTLANRIIANASLVYPKFKNKKNDRDTYNFWATDPPTIFPHSGWLNLFNKSQSLPDDLDDTVIILMAQQSNDSTAKSIHKLMQNYTNNDKKRITNTFPEYKNVGAYSTWFGEKMPVDFDICVLSNLLYFVQYYDLKWTSADSASLFMIEEMIKTGKHRNFANYVSPHYATFSNILYHISRLMSLKPIPALENLKAKLIEETKVALASSKIFIERVILSTSLLKWGVTPPDILIKDSSSLIDLIENEEFTFFIASMASMLPDEWKKIMTNLKVGTFYYYCPGYNYVLLLENLIWRKRRGLSQ